MNNIPKEVLKIEKNIISWYPFIYNSKILCININNQELIKELKRKIEKITQIEDYNQLDLIKEEKYDYIFLYGLNKDKYNLKHFLDLIEGYLKQDGIILIACNNKYGIENSNTNVKENCQENLYSKAEIENELSKNKLMKYKFYYPLPNFKIPNVIFTDKNLPDYESIQRDLTLYSENEIINFDEREIYKKIIKENKYLFPFFANSFVVEISNCDNEIKFVSFNNSRKEQYRINTIMKDKYVYKEINCERAEKHFKNIKNNIVILKELGFKLLDEFNEKKLYSKIMPQDRQFDKVLINLFENDKCEEAYYLIELFIDEIKSKLLQESNEINIFEKNNIKISEELDKKLLYIKYGFFDLIFQNCFFVDNNFYFYDQEWIEENMPIQFIIYRAIEYLSNSSKVINKEQLFEKFRITEFISVFNELETKIQKKIKDETIWKIHATNRITVKNVFDTKVHYYTLYNNIKVENEKLHQQLEIINKEKQEIYQENKKINEEKQKLFDELREIKQSKLYRIMHKLKKM